MLHYGEILAEGTPEEIQQNPQGAGGLSQDMSAAGTNAQPLVSVEDVHTYYGKSHILHGVSLQVGPGEVVGLLGRNGVGKSTTLKTIMGLVQPSQGKVLFDGNAITGLPPHKLARLGIGYVPEDRRIFRLLTVMENLRTGLDRHGVSEEAQTRCSTRSFTFFPVLAERRNQAGGTLSGGEQQMLAIARAMMLEPKIILLDEPTEGLDAAHGVADPRDHRRAAQRRRRHPAGGAERAADAGGQPARLHHGEGRACATIARPPRSTSTTPSSSSIWGCDDARAGRTSSTTFPSIC